jgi:hypothetical protein
VAKRVKFSVKLVKDNLPALGLSMKLLKRTDVLVGIPEDTAPRDLDPGAAPINNATIAYIQDTGSPAANIPARPFMNPGIQDAKAPIIARMKGIGEAALNGQALAILKGFYAVGLLASTAIKKRIVSGPFAPLKPATIAARERHGRTGDKPLIDTSQMLKAVNYIVREKT